MKLVLVLILTKRITICELLGPGEQILITDDSN